MTLEQSRKRYRTIKSVVKRLREEKAQYYAELKRKHEDRGVIPL